MLDEKSEIIQVDTTAEKLDIIAFATSAIPWIGGPLSNVLSSVSTERKLQPIREVVKGFVSDLKEFKSEASIKYVRTEEFEKLLAYALEKAEREPSREERQLLQAFLTDLVKACGVRFSKSEKGLGEVAKKLGHSIVGRPHILYFLLEDVAFFDTHLGHFNISEEELRMRLDQLLGKMLRDETKNDIQLSQNARKIIHRAQQFRSSLTCEKEYDCIWFSLCEHTVELLGSERSLRSESGLMWITFVRDTPNLLMAVKQDTPY